jgi:hypothetical protein
VIPGVATKDIDSPFHYPFIASAAVIPRVMSHSQLKVQLISQYHNHSHLQMLWLIASCPTHSLRICSQTSIRVLEVSLLLLRFITHAHTHTHTRTYTYTYTHTHTHTHTHIHNEKLYTTYKLTHKYNISSSLFEYNAQYPETIISC